jgi:hypothetical protein
LINRLFIGIEFYGFIPGEQIKYGVAFKRQLLQLYVLEVVMRVKLRNFILFVAMTGTKNKILTDKPLYKRL